MTRRRFLLDLTMAAGGVAAAALWATRPEPASSQSPPLPPDVPPTVKGEVAVPPTPTPMPPGGVAVPPAPAPSPSPGTWEAEPRGKVAH